MGSVSETLAEDGVALLNSDNHAGVSNSVEDCRASNVAAMNVSDTSLSVKGNDVADVDARSFVLTSRPPVALDECSDSTMITEPADVELQQKIVHQMEVCLQFVL